MFSTQNESQHVDINKIRVEQVFLGPKRLNWARDIL